MVLVWLKQRLVLSRIGIYGISYGGGFTSLMSLSATRVSTPPAWSRASCKKLIELEMDFEVMFCPMARPKLLQPS